MTVRDLAKFAAEWNAPEQITSFEVATHTTTNNQEKTMPSTAVTIAESITEEQKPSRAKFFRTAPRQHHPVGSALREFGSDLSASVAAEEAFYGTINALAAAHEYLSGYEKHLTSWEPKPEIVAAMMLAARISAQDALIRSGIEMITKHLSGGNKG